ncbi:hypothetical protein C2S51_011675 [Perilla frutescens var. frutescens]|nr:hypothetical protein C2S51_011675 [Perilla frutescens var. frutescens]
MEAPAPIVVREVWQSNLAAEISLIQRHLQEFPYISMDTEFPGIVFKPPIPPKSKHNPPPPPLSPSELYALMKRNVDTLCIIQLGLTLSDAVGNLPSSGGSRHVWEFNFADFDSDSDPHNPESVSLLERQGINFLKNKLMGIDSHAFALLFKLSGLGLRAIRRRNLTWVTFHGVYDFGFLVKILTGSQLPETLQEFMVLLRHYFGPVVYDLKPMARRFGLHGGLERIAKSLMVDRAVGRSHQAGSDSLLTMRVFVELIKKFGGAKKIEEFNYMLFGLTPIL